MYKHTLEGCRYYVPKSKRDLVNWFVQNKGWVKSRLNKMTIKQLFAIYHKERGNYDK